MLTFVLHSLNEIALWIVACVSARWS